jgi:hypothetical protein
MKAGRDWDDNTFRTLLHDYREPRAGAELRKRIEDAAAAAGIGKAPTQATRGQPLQIGTHLSVLPRAVRPLAAVVAVAAALALVFGLVQVVLLGTTRFDQDLIVASPEASTDAQGTGGGLRSVSGWVGLVSPAGQSLLVSGQDILITLRPDTSLDIRPATALERLAGMAPLQYRLAKGGLEFDHGSRAPDFILNTPFGELRPVGTAFSISVSDLSLDLAVVQGAVSFRESDGRLDSLGAGQSLHLRRSSPGGRAEAVAPTTPVLAPSASPLVAPSLSAGASPSPAAAASPTPASFQAPKASAPPVPAAPTLRMLWETKLQVSAGGRLYLSPAGASRSVVLVADGQALQARDARTGQIIWTRTLDQTVQSMVAVEAGLLVHTGSQLECLDWQSGYPRWAGVAGPLSLNHPTQARGSVVLASADGSLTSWSANTGLVEGRFKLGSGSYGTPLVGANFILASRLPRQLVAIDRQSGTELWSFTAGARFAGDLPLTLPGSDLIRVMDSAGTWYGLDARTGTERFRLAGSPQVSFGPVLLGDIVLVQDSKGVAALDNQGKRQDLGGPGVERILAIWGQAAADGPWLVAATKGLFWLEMPEAKWTALDARSFRAADQAGPSLVTLDENGQLQCWRVSH